MPRVNGYTWLDGVYVEQYVETSRTNLKDPTDPNKWSPEDLIYILAVDYGVEPCNAERVVNNHQSFTLTEIKDLRNYDYYLAIVLDYLCECGIEISPKELEKCRVFFDKGIDTHTFKAKMVDKRLAI